MSAVAATSRSSRVVGSTLAPAKLNLSLRIVGRRDDGYHLLESLMVPISLYDRVELAVDKGPRGVTCAVDGPERVAGGPRNLASRAARSVLSACGARARVAIRLHKVVPAGAGLGGGSSDAAAVLRLLPRMLGHRFSAAELAEMAVALGADVPFFLSCRPALAAGIGEILTPLPRFPAIDLVVAVPHERVETAWAYANALPARPSAARRGRAGADRLPLSAKTISSLFFNDFERGVGDAVPAVRRLVRTLRGLGARATVMSGSGSAVAASFAGERRARDATATFAAPDKAFAVRVLRRRPATRILRGL